MQGSTKIMRHRVTRKEEKKIKSRQGSCAFMSYLI